MEKLKSTFLTIVLSLTCICLVAGLALSAANTFPKEKIAESNAAALQAAIKKVAPEFDNHPAEEQFKVGLAEGDSLVVYPAKKGGESVGAAIESYTKNGFGGMIRIMVGFDAEHKLVNYSILEHNETPGLGSKMEEWFRVEKNKQNIIGRDMKGAALTVSKDGGDVDAITAATISSRAFLEAVARAYAAYNGHEADGTSGATSKESEE